MTPFQNKSPPMAPGWHGDVPVALRLGPVTLSERLSHSNLLRVAPPPPGRQKHGGSAQGSPSWMVIARGPRMCYKSLMRRNKACTIRSVVIIGEWLPITFSRGARSVSQEAFLRSVPCLTLTGYVQFDQSSSPIKQHLISRRGISPVPWVILLKNTGYARDRNCI